MTDLSANNSIELFCGTGGLALGLQKAGFHHNALYELDRDSCENIRANIESGYNKIKDWNIYQTDVRAVSYKNFAGKIDMISGGPPCQPFSLGGKAQAHRDIRDMFPEAVRAVREIMPQAFIFENVKGLLRKSFSMYFGYIILQLTYPSIEKKQGMTWEEHHALLEQHHTSNRHNDCEYNVLYRLLNAADYGVPQLRNRVFIVGFRKDVNARWSFPEPTHSKESLLYDKWISGSYWERHHISKPSDHSICASTMKKICSSVKDTDTPLLPWQTTRDAIGNMPDPRRANHLDNHKFRAGAKTYPGHSGSILDEPSKTIKAGVHGVPGGENTIIQDDGSVRYYTVRESARIQTFPDDYRFVASWSESMRQIGNAVPVKLAETVGASVIQHLGNVYNA